MKLNENKQNQPKTQKHNYKEPPSPTKYKLMKSDKGIMKLLNKYMTKHITCK